MSDDFYNQNIGPLKGSYFGPGVGSFESQQRSSDYFSKSIDPVRDSIKKTEERRMEAERARQIIEAENERRRRAAAEAAAEKAAQEKVEGVFGKVDTILQIEDPVERQAALNQLESSLSIADRQDSKIKAALAMTQQEIDDAEEETKAQREAQDSSAEARAKLLISRGKLKQARAKAKEITDPAKRDEILSTIAGEKPSTAAGLKEQFADITKRADSALSELSKIEPSSVAQEPEDEGAETGDTLGVEFTKAPQGEGTQGEGTQEEGTQGEGTQEEDTLDFDLGADSGTSTSRANRQILQAARDSYAEMFGAKKADELFDQYDADNISASERRELVDKFSKKLKGIKSRSISNKKFLEQFVPRKRLAPRKGKAKTSGSGSESKPRSPLGSMM